MPGRLTIRSRTRAKARAASLPVLLCSPVVASLPVKDASRFCLRDGAGRWSPSRYPPLSDVEAREVSAQIVFTGPWLPLPRVRHLDPRIGMTDEDQSYGRGRLLGMRGVMQRRSLWIAKANLYPKADGGFEPSQVRFFRSMTGESIPDPEKVADYLPQFEKAQVYRTIEQIPCAGLLQESEKN